MKDHDPLSTVSEVPEPLKEVAGFLLNHLAARLREETAQRIAALGLRPRQVGILLLLKQTGELSQQALGQALAMDRTTAMQLVSALEHTGWVIRYDAPEDRRAYRIKLTAAGRRLTQTLESKVREAEDLVLARLTREEKNQLKELTRKALEVSAD